MEREGLEAPVGTGMPHLFSGLIILILSQRQACNGVVYHEVVVSCFDILFMPIPCGRIVLRILVASDFVPDSSRRIL